MNFTLPTDPHELAWLTNIAISAHCDISAYGKWVFGHGVVCKSTVSHLLAETKSASVREYSGKLLPLLGALSAIDQYGTCYEPIPATFPTGLSNKSGIIKAAHNFLGISVNSPDSDALYALRNSLMHQSSLISVGAQSKPKHFWFEIENENNKNIFKHAKTPWNGIYNTRCADNKTIVNSKLVMDLAFTLIDKLKQAHSQAQLRLTLANGLQELLTSYVDLKFNISLHDSFIEYIGNIIYTELYGQPDGIRHAEKILSTLPQGLKDEAAKWLLAQLSGEKLSKISKAYPAVLHP